MSLVNKVQDNKNKKFNLIFLAISIFVLSSISFAVENHREIQNVNQRNSQTYSNTVLIKDAKFMVDNKLPIIDIREDFEWIQTGVIRQSKLITLKFDDSYKVLNEDQFIQSVSKYFKKDDNFLIICRSANRTKHALNLLNKNGFKNVMEVDGGIKNWLKSGFELVKY